MILPPLVGTSPPWRMRRKMRTSPSTECTRPTKNAKTAAARKSRFMRLDRVMYVHSWCLSLFERRLSAAMPPTRPLELELDVTILSDAGSAGDGACRIGDPFAPRSGVESAARESGNLHRQRVMAGAHA